MTNRRRKSSKVAKFDNKHGTVEQWSNEDGYIVNVARLSCHGVVDKQVRLQLFALACNLGNVLRQLALPEPVKKWWLTTLREKLIKIGVKVVRHSICVMFQMAEVAVPRVLFREILGRIERLRSGQNLWERYDRQRSEGLERQYEIAGRGVSRKCHDVGSSTDWRVLGLCWRVS